MLKNFRGLNFYAVKFRRIDHTYKSLTCAQTIVAPSYVEQRWRSLNDVVVFEAVTFIKMSEKLLLERCWLA